MSVESISEVSFILFHILSQQLFDPDHWFDHVVHTPDAGFNPMIMLARQDICFSLIVTSHTKQHSFPQQINPGPLTHKHPHLETTAQKSSPHSFRPSRVKIPSLPSPTTFPQHARKWLVHSSRHFSSVVKILKMRFRPAALHDMRCAYADLCRRIPKESPNPSTQTRGKRYERKENHMFVASSPCPTKWRNDGKKSRFFLHPLVRLLALIKIRQWQ